MGDLSMPLFSILDLKKAFDTMDHDILLSKLQAYDIQGPTNQPMAFFALNKE